MNLDAHYRASDIDAARQLIARLDKLHGDRLESGRAGRDVFAVRASLLILDLVDTATVPQLRAAVVLLSTPELRSVPVVVADQPGGGR